MLILYILLLHLYFMNFNYSLTSLFTEKKSPACTRRSIEIFLLCWSLAAGHWCFEPASISTGIEAGSVVITDTAVDSSFQPRFEQVVLGDVVVRSTELDKGLAEELLACSRDIPDFPTLIGHTMCTYDFYEGKTCSVCPSPPHLMPSLPTLSIDKAIQGAQEGCRQRPTWCWGARAEQGAPPEPTVPLPAPC